MLNLGDVYRRLSMTSAAGASYRRGRELAETALVATPTDALARSALAYLACRLGDAATARREMPQALRAGASNPTVFVLAAATYEALGERNRAIDVLGSAPSAAIYDVARHADLGALRADPRFAALLATATKSTQSTSRQ